MILDVDQSIGLAGVELPYVRRGVTPGEGCPMLLLHGGGGPLSKLPFFESLTKHYDVIAPVHPGFASTPIPQHFDGLEDLVYVYLDFLDALELEDVIVMGFSMGGWLAAEIAVRSSACLGRLILVDSVGIKPGGRESRDIADAFGLSGPDLIDRLFHDRANAPDMSQATDDELAIHAANRTALALYSWEPYMHNPKLPHRLHRITMPTLFIWGESDGIVDVDYARAFQGMISGAELVVVPEAGHQPQVEQPQKFLEAVESFLT